MFRDWDRYEDGESTGWENRDGVGNVWVGREKKCGPEWRSPARGVRG